MCSAHRQTSPEFRIILVCHDVPDWAGDYPQCTVIEAPFPPPERRDDLPPNDRNTLYAADKGRKVLLGLQYCREHYDGHFMVLDADDYVSNCLAAFVAEHPQANGWYFEEGYRRDLSIPWLLYKRKNFYHECGSSFILKTSVAPYPETLDLSKDISDKYIRRYEVHAYIPECMSDLGYPLVALPFPGAIYQFHTQNMYATSMRSNGLFRKLARIVIKGISFSKKLKEEFTSTCLK